jgi:hypothetical protein
MPGPHDCISYFPDTLERQTVELKRIADAMGARAKPEIGKAVANATAFTMAPVSLEACNNNPTCKGCYAFYIVGAHEKGICPQ